MNYTDQSSDRERLEATLPELRSLLFRQGVLQDDILRIEKQFEAGQSNPTYLLGSGERLLALRKQPFGEIQPRAHDVVREHNIMKALFDAGFAVPRPVFASEDRDVIGTSFFIMEYVPGAVFSDPAMLDQSGEQRGVVYRAMGEKLAGLHLLDPAVLQPAGVIPRPDFVGRQIKTWRTAYLAAQTDADDRIESVAQWLMDRKPVNENARIVHGDFRIENLIVQDSEIAAVLDWELCTVGEPMSDLAYCCIWYHLDRATLNGLADLDLRALGIPSEDEFLDLYENRTGINVRATHRYFLAFAFYRLASILQGVYRRALDGNAASPQAFSRGRMAKVCLQKAAEFARL